MCCRRGHWPDTPARLPDGVRAGLPGRRGVLGCIPARIRHRYRRCVRLLPQPCHRPRPVPAPQFGAAGAVSGPAIPPASHALVAVPIPGEGLIIGGQPAPQQEHQLGGRAGDCGHRVARTARCRAQIDPFGLSAANVIIRAGRTDRRLGARLFKALRPATVTVTQSGPERPMFMHRRAPQEHAMSAAGRHVTGTD